MSAHLVPGRVLVLEPWWFPDRFVDGSVGGGPGAGAGVGRMVARVSHSTRYGRVTRMEERWLVGDAAGIREFSQIGLLTMFTRAERLSAFAATGRDARNVEGWLSGRGLFVADRTGGGEACGDLDSDACKKLARPRSRSTPAPSPSFIRHHQPLSGKYA
ncbi:SAM-dependent methyltransferase [Salinispora arenicola]|uniref:SAM-dependent methyltransferase n=1 Tax=Salinispora arenicola TaxID=168697 RepID=UPI001430FD3A|nr:SAM-dependent methyltransferase [Salinispora arenicola]NIL40017.1 SAM-dependent methyltransferase [Salinispora arenicola]